MNKAFVTWDPSTIKNGFLVTDLFGVERTHIMAKGESVQAKFPATASFKFDPDFKRHTVLVDCVLNVESAMLCSERVKDFIAARNPEKLEYLPVHVLDHKRKPVDAKYFIIHPIDPPDCIDKAKSKFKMSKVDPDSMLSVEHLEIDASKVPANRLIFRPKGYNEIILMRRELAEALEATDFTGVGWAEIK